MRKGAPARVGNTVRRIVNSAALPIFIGLSIILLTVSGVCLAQTDAIGSLTYSVNLPDRWRYQQGDNPQWAAADFDDSSWQELNIKENPVKQGIKPAGS